MFVIPSTKHIASRILDFPEPLRPVIALKDSSNPRGRDTIRTLDMETSWNLTYQIWLFWRDKTWSLQVMRLLLSSLRLSLADSPSKMSSSTLMSPTAFTYPIVSKEFLPSLPNILIVETYCTDLLPSPLICQLREMFKEGLGGKMKD